MGKIVTSAYFQADLQVLYSIIQWVREEANKCSFSKKDLYHIELAIEEAVVNIIRHGYQKKQGKIQIKILRNKDCFEVEIQDKAPPFNPLNDRPLKKSSDIGIGILLLQNCMDEVSYLRKGSYNLLLLKKNCQ